VSAAPRSRWREGLAILLLRNVPFWQGSWRRRVGRVVVFGCYAYLGVLLVLLALENALLFPRATFAQEWFAPPPELHVRDVELKAANGTALHAWWTAPPGWAPQHGAVLFSHGNGGNLSSRGPVGGRWRAELGRAVLLYDYPGYGKSEGLPSEAGCYASGEAAYRWLVGEQQVPQAEVVHVGESLGGAIATELAVRHRCRALILLFPFTSFPDMAQQTVPWLPARWLVRNRLDNLAKIDQVGCPVFITHGTADRVIPFRQGERLYEAAREPKRFLRISGMGHRHPVGAEFYAAVRAFLDATRP
jgi:fermentation-respiration switch protein FrsA (DUF1100 family)